MPLILVFESCLEVNSAAPDCRTPSVLYLNVASLLDIRDMVKLLAFTEYLAVIPVNQDDVSVTLRF